MKYLLEKDKKRRKLFCKHEKKRILIKALIRNENLSRSARWKLSLKLATLPKNGTISRIRNITQYIRLFQSCLPDFALRPSKVLDAI